jgi:transaldolase
LNYAFDTQVLAASIRHPMHIIECAKMGADVVTAPLSALIALFNHPLTDKGLEIFIKDAEKWK